MKQSPDYLLRTVAGTQVLVPVGDATNRFIGMVTVNTTSAYLWEQLATEQTEETLVQALLSKYQVEEALAREDVKKFLATLTAIGALT